MKRCDSVDNDCDGKTDEAYRIGQACTVGSGACANPNGMWVCDNTVPTGAPLQRLAQDARHRDMQRPG